MAILSGLEVNVDSDRILDSPEVLAGFSQDRSFVPKIRPRYVVQPTDANQVQAIVKWANETLTPLIPISSGPPHFRGDTVPSVGGGMIVDLSRMKKIKRIDPRNRVAMVEPGVTFAELVPALKKEGLCAYTPLCPRSTKSVIGSMLERDPVTMPAHHWDSTDPMLCAEIVFGSGDKLRGGEAAGPDTIEEQWELGKAHMTPFGLSQFNEHRLISGAQGTMGIVTWSTLKCRLASQANVVQMVAADNIDALLELSYRLLRFRLGDHCFIVNGLNLACLLGLTDQEIDSLKDLLPPWILVASFEAYGELAEEKVQYQEADFKDIAVACRLKPEDKLAGIRAEALAEVLDQPSSDPYWKLRYKGGFHDIFFQTTLDRTPEFVAATIELATTVQYPVEDIGIYIQPMVQGTSCHCEFTLYSDSAKKEASSGFKWLVTEGGRKLARKGAFFSRPYGAWADFAYADAMETVVMQRKVKDIFDPNGIMNPGKLCF